MYKPVKPKHSGSNCCGTDGSWFMFLLIVGGFATALVVVGCNLQFAGFNFTNFNFKGVTATKAQSGKLVENIQSIEVINKHGDVKVVQSDEPGWSWSLKTWADTQELADSYNAEILCTIDELHEEQKWELLLPDDLSDCNGIESNLTIKVPQHVTVSITNQHGETSVANVDGKVAIESKHGDLDLQSLAAAALINSQHGDVKVTDFGGGQIDNAHGELIASGSTGELSIESRHGRLKISDVAGDLRIDGAHGDLTVGNASADVAVDYRHGDMKIECSGSQLYCQSAHGDVDVTMHSSAASKVEIKGSHSDIKVWLPSDSSPQISANASHGKISNAFADENGQGKLIVDLRTSHDDIRIKKLKVSEVQVSAPNTIQN